MVISEYGIQVHNNYFVKLYIIQNYRIEWELLNIENSFKDKLKLETDW